MFLRARLSSLNEAALPFAAAAFILGLAVGAYTGAAGPMRRADIPPARAEPAYASGGNAQVLRVIDGDTFEARVHVWPGIEIATKVRLRGIDAPEMKARCRGEMLKADEARAALAAILAQGQVSVSRVAFDKYGGRVVADASARATPDVSAAMLERQLVRRYGGGRRESWCD
jgi:endonuclease YncB( thermonuclease family)